MPSNQSLTDLIDMDTIKSIADILSETGIFTEHTLANVNLYPALQYHNQELISIIKKHSNLKNILCSAVMTEYDGLVYYLHTYDEENSLSIDEARNFVINFKPRYL